MKLFADCSEKAFYASGLDSDLTQFADVEARSLIFRAADLRARFFLLDRAEELYEERNFEGAAACFHAMMYLEDRLSYELWPPPSKMAIPLRLESDDSCS